MRRGVPVAGYWAYFSASGGLGCRLGWPQRVVRECRNGRKLLIKLTGGDHFIGTHHLIVFVFQNVAVPDVASGVSFERSDDARNHSRIGAHRILPSRFASLGGRDAAGISKHVLVLISEGVKTAAVQDLETHQVQMNG